MNELTKTKAIEKMKVFKKECTDAYFRFKELKKTLNAIQKKAGKLRYDLDYSSKLYITESVKDSDGTEKDWTHSDGWNENLIGCLMDIEDFFPKSIESIDVCLANVKNIAITKHYGKESKK